jgi:ferritin-like metal-binding protein YciE
MKNGIKSWFKSDNESNYKIENVEGGLEELFLKELKDILWAEEALVDALPKMIEQAESEEFKDAIEEHLAQTEEHVSRLEEIFELLEMEPESKKCVAMKGLISEAEDLMDDLEDGPVKDAGIIAAAQKVEHYEIATYGTLRTYASLLGLGEVEEILLETLDEEKEADEILSEIADSINIEAVLEGDDEEGDDSMEDEEWR